MDTKYTREELEKALRFMLAMVQEPKLMPIVADIFKYGSTIQLENVLNKANGNSKCAICSEPCGHAAYCENCDKIMAN